MQALFEALRARGWQDEGDVLYAPGKSMWLVTTCGWPTSIEQFLADMKSRTQRLRRIRDAMNLGPDEVEAVLADAESALEAAEEVGRATIEG